jgi:hypothetical protein
MTDLTDIALPQPTRVGQGTAIEQSRAVAEVYAAVMVARDVPRSVQNALRDMREVCAMPALAERAFFEFPRGGSTIAGASVYLARELARCWGNVQHGVAELRRDDDHGQSEMLAFAWDLQSNTRVQTIFIVPHMRDRKGGPVKLVDMRDLYENNANQGARRVRECIFAVVPVWFRNEAEDICRLTLTKGEKGKTLAQRVADALARFADLDVLESDLVRRVGRPVEEWTASTVGALVTTYQSLKRGEISREEAFPPHLVSPEEIERQAQPAASASSPRLTHEFTPEQAEEAIRADAVARSHADGHSPVPAEKRVWDPECPICAELGDEAAQRHYYGHTVDFVEGCPACEQEQAWREESGQ